VLYVFLVLAHDRRRIVHFNVTAHPTAERTAQQLREAFPFERVPKYLLRDRDRIFGVDFTQQVEDLSIEEVLSAPRSPWQRAYIERVIGSIRRGAQPGFPSACRRCMERNLLRSSREGSGERCKGNARRLRGFREAQALAQAVEAPWIRRYPQARFSSAIRTTSPSISSALRLLPGCPSAAVVLLRDHSSVPVR